MKRGGIDKRKRRKVAWVQVKSVIEKSVNALPADSCRSPFPQSKLWGINRAPLSADRPAQSECNCLQRHRFRPCTPYICTDDVSCNRRGVVTRALQALKVPVNCANEPERCLIFLPKFYILVFIYSLPPPFINRPTSSHRLNIFKEILYATNFAIFARSYRDEKGKLYPERSG